MPSFDPESVDLAVISAHLDRVCGASVRGAVVGRTLLRDEIARHLGCSQLEAELLVDTMIGRGFLVRENPDGGPDEWVIRGPGSQ